MTTSEKFNQLFDKELAAKTDTEYEQIQAEFDALYESDPEGFELAFTQRAKRTAADAKQLRIKEQLADMEQIVSMSYIAKTYFNKTKSWLSQRINNSVVNGKRVAFKPEEIETLNAAFQDISKKIGAFSVTSRI